MNLKEMEKNFWKLERREKNDRKRMVRKRIWRPRHFGSKNDSKQLQGNEKMTDFIIGIRLGFLLGTITGTIFGQELNEWMKKWLKNQ